MVTGAGAWSSLTSSAGPEVSLWDVGSGCGTWRVKVITWQCANALISVCRWLESADGDDKYCEMSSPDPKEVPLINPGENVNIQHSFNVYTMLEPTHSMRRHRTDGWVIPPTTVEVRRSLAQHPSPFSLNFLHSHVHDTATQSRSSRATEQASTLTYKKFTSSPLPKAIFLQQLHTSSKPVSSKSSVLIIFTTHSGSALFSPRCCTLHLEILCRMAEPAKWDTYSEDIPSG